MRPLSKVAPQWWDYTTLDRAILDDAASLSQSDERFYKANTLGTNFDWAFGVRDNP